MASPCGFASVLVDCPPSPCARLSRAPTTTGTRPPVRDTAGLGGVPGFANPGARIGVRVFIRSNPWCVRWLALPLAALAARHLRDQRARAHDGRTQPATLYRPRPGYVHAFRRDTHPYRGF